MTQHEILYPDESVGPFILREQAGRIEIYNVENPTTLVGRAPNLNRAMIFVDELMERAPSTGSSETIPGAITDPNAPPQPEPQVRTPGPGELVQFS